MSLQQQMKNGSLYDCSSAALTAELEEQLYNCKELLYDFNHSRPREEEKRTQLLGKLLASMGNNCYIEPPLHANWGCNTHLGNDFYANFNLTLVDDADIYIGDHVMIAPNVVLTTGTHPILPALRERVFQYNLPIHIGNNVWIGAGSIVLPGVTIGDNTVIGAGSVVTADIPAGVVAYGTPCRVVRKISEYDRTFYAKDRRIPQELLNTIDS